MIRIDAHQHFWKFDPMEHAWMTDEMRAVKRDFLAGDLQPLLDESRIDGTVLVQVSQSDQETENLLKIAEAHSFVKGVVGWVDLRDDNLYSLLSNYRKFPKLKGFRHILQVEEPRRMLEPDFLRGIATLREFNYTYDILIYPRHLDVAAQLVEQFPGQKFVVDHLAKPDIKRHDYVGWDKGIAQLASYPNVYCKISGMVTEADWNAWEQGDFSEFMDIVIRAFGIDRVMFGSDWPMCLVAASYQDVLKIVTDYFATFSIEEQQLFFGGNAREFYQL